MNEGILAITGALLVIWAILGESLSIEIKVGHLAPLDDWKRLVFAMLGLTLIVVSIWAVLDVKRPRLRPNAVQENLQATFLGQDGENYAGRQCARGAENDNVHIHLDGLRADVQPVSFRVEDRNPGSVLGVWAVPCDPVSNWLLYVISSTPGQADLYFKPFREAPDGTEYTIIVQYEDGTNQSTEVVGSRVVP